MRAVFSVKMRKCIKKKEYGNKETKNVAKPARIALTANAGCASLVKPMLGTRLRQSREYDIINGLTYKYYLLDWANEYYRAEQGSQFLFLLKVCFPIFQRMQSKIQKPVMIKPTGIPQYDGRRFISSSSIIAIE